MITLGSLKAYSKLTTGLHIVICLSRACTSFGLRRTHFYAIGLGFADAANLGELQRYTVLCLVGLTGGSKAAYPTASVSSRYPAASVQSSDGAQV